MEWEDQPVTVHFMWYLPLLSIGIKMEVLPEWIINQAILYG